jgi:hypothetical protein
MSNSTQNSINFFSGKGENRIQADPRDAEYGFLPMDDFTKKQALAVANKLNMRKVEESQNGESWYLKRGERQFEDKADFMSQIS